MKWSYFCVMALVYLFVINAHADESYPKDRCRTIKNPNDLFKCILSSHPDVKIQEAQVKEEEKTIEFAGQRPNPEFGLEGVDNKTGGISSEVAILHTFELGGKRSSRIRVAQAQVYLSKSELLKTQENISIQTVLNIYRLRQIETELKVVRENLNTFRKIRQRYVQTGRLNPEQQISLSVFKLAEEDNKLKENALIGEKEGILSEFRMVAGDTLVVESSILPAIQKKWPNISVDRISGADSLLASNSLAIAEAEKKLAESESWPDLSIGPKVEVDTGQNKETRMGIALSMPLPFYNINSGGKAKALLGVKKNELKEKWTRRNLESKVQLLLADYKRFSNAVSNSMAESHVGSKHEELHKLINRGVISAPLIIEMHREMFEFYENLHAQELKALESLWTLYALRGTILEENLQ